MLELHTRQVYSVDTTTIKRARKNGKERFRGDKAESLLIAHVNTALQIFEVSLTELRKSQVSFTC